VHQGRRLAWLHHLGKADVRLNYLRKKYLVTASDFQTAVLLLFNKRAIDQRLSWEECAAGNKHMFVFCFVFTLF
jgi:hypothetical protein